LPSALLALRRGVQSDDLTQYCRVLARLYAAIREVSGCSVIVDSTKDPPYAFLLRLVPDLDLRFVHLLRDSRGVAYSWLKKGIRVPEHVDDSTFAFMPSPSPWRSALKWVVTNMAFSSVARSSRLQVVKYEDLMSEPAQQLERVLRLASEGRVSPSAAPETGRDFEYLPFHTVGGNPVRFKRGSISLHADYEWKTKMRRSHKLVVSAITLPLLLAYGYVGVSARRRRFA